MTCYIKLSTLEYPRYEGDIRLEYEGIPEHLTGDDFPCPDTYARVYGEIPEVDTDVLKVTVQAPKCVNGVWKLMYTIVPLTQDELDDRERAHAESFNPLAGVKFNYP
jgi:hypothetical protein